MTTTELQVKIDQLTLSVEQSNELTRKYEGEITDLKKKLEDLNKPKLTAKQLDAVNEAIEEAIGQWDFDGTDNYSIDYGIDYNGRVYCESFSFDNADDLHQEIYNAVEDLFEEVEDDNQENQN